MNEERLLEEFSKLNNELINTRRELSRLNAELEQKEQFLNKILDLSPFIVYVFDLERGSNVYASGSIASILGYGADEIRDLGDRFLPALLHPEDQKRFASQAESLRRLPDGQKEFFEYRMRDKSGTWRWLRSTDTVFERNPAGDVRRTIGTVQDISVEKTREALLEEASLVDDLTGLRNRRSFGELASQHMRGSIRRNESFAIIFFDLDHFKSINDRFGHAEGDAALKAPASILGGCFRSGDVLARHGGDEFVALLSEAGADATTLLVDRVRRCTADWNGQSGKPWQLAFSIGTAIFDPASPRSLADLIESADRAMYSDKNSRVVAPQ